MPLEQTPYQSVADAAKTMNEISSAPARRRLVPVIQAPRGGRGSSPLDQLVALASRVAAREGLFDEVAS